jgi:hypothetical protein
VERHFRQVHLPSIIRSVPAHTLSGTACLQFPVPAIRQLARQAWEEQMRFPIKIVTLLSQQFASHGLQFFKVNKSVTHVSVARPHFLDVEATPVSAGIKRIIDFIEATPKCTRRKILESLAPTQAPPAAPKTEATAESTPPAPTAPAPQPEISLEQSVINADLHWLIHQGHVIEFANGLVETAKRPIPKPVARLPKPARPAPAPAPAAAPAKPATPVEPAVTAASPAPEPAQPAPAEVPPPENPVS